MTAAVSGEKGGERAEALPTPEEIETVDPVEDLAKASPEPEMLPPSEVAMPLPPIPPRERVETAEVKPKPEPKKSERKKRAPKKPPDVQPPPADA